MKFNYLKKSSKYKKKLFFSFFLIVLLFSVIVAGFQYNQERQFKREKLEYALNIYNQQIHKLIKKQRLLESVDYSGIDSLRQLMPEEDMRITIISPTGQVIYDSSVKHLSRLDNHLQRPEVQKSKYSQKGSNIRLSGSTGKTYYYYSRFYYDYFIRTALPYDEDIINFLKANNLFLYFMLGLFGVTLLLLIYVTDHLGNSISKLKHFAVRAARNEDIDDTQEFGKTELEEIHQQIIKIYKQLKNTTEELSQEKEKLIKHLQIAQEGIAIFNPKKELILWNSHFIDYINFISNINHQNYKEIFKLKELKDLTQFINTNIKHLDGKFVPNVDMISTKKTLVIGHRVFLYQVVIFLDGSFEISVSDITKSENEKTIKQEMTLNIAHELKTPVTAISGFLETLKDNPDLPAEKAHQFIERSCIQVNRLSSLIQDISVLTKIEEASNLFEVSQVPIRLMLDEIVADFELKLTEQKITCEIDVSRHQIVKGNPELLDAIFRNLIDNSIKYAGEGTVIQIKNYFEDANYYYFSLADTGNGIPEQHLSRIFERFYRADNGRARKLGGTGLGLSIVKNAIGFHKGRIYAKNRPEGGIEFFFSIKKEL
ncbi:MAG: sensor histidine kinase [Marinifilaceae bacterium]